MLGRRATKVSNRQGDVTAAVHDHQFDLVLAAWGEVSFTGFTSSGALEPLQSFRARIGGEELPPRALALGDFDGDGVLDLAVGNGQLHLLWGLR